MVKTHETLIHATPKDVLNFVAAGSSREDTRITGMSYSSKRASWEYIYYREPSYRSHRHYIFISSCTVYSLQKNGFLVIPLSDIACDEVPIQQALGFPGYSKARVFRENITSSEIYRTYGFYLHGEI